MTTQLELPENGSEERRRAISGLNVVVNADPDVRHWVAAYFECSPEIQEIVKEMFVIIRDSSAEADDIEMAMDTIVEALFPSLTVNVDNADKHRCDSEIAAAVNAALDKEEKAFSDRVRQLMLDQEMKQEELAELTGVSQPAISNILNRNCRPRRATVEKFAKALGVTSQALWPELPEQFGPMPR